MGVADLARSVAEIVLNMTPATGAWAIYIADTVEHLPDLAPPRSLPITMDLSAPLATLAAALSAQY